MEDFNKEQQNPKIKKIEIEKGQNDPRTFNYEVLENGVKLLLISDEEAECSACAIRVDVGSFSEPKEYPGLAHFLEHMLFLGSKKYPMPSEYNKFFAKYGGFNNAWTDDHYTTFLFDISDHSQLEEALDRTINFFIGPLFNEEYIEKELNAVDSEYKENYSDDEWRFWAIFGRLAKKGSPFRKFTLGNMETLKKDGIRDALIDFWQKYYSSNLMNVVIYGKRSVEELRNISIPILEQIENKNKKIVSFGGIEAHFGDEEKQKFIQHKSIKDEYLIKFIFFVPASNVDKTDNSNAFYIKYLLENEHEGSIHNILHDRNLILSLSCMLHNNANCFSVLVLEIHLSEIGKGQITTVMEVVGAYINKIQKSGPQKWFYEENLRINDIEFNHEPKIHEYNYVSNLVHSFDNRDKSMILHKGVYAPYDEGRLRDFIKNYIKIKNMIIMYEGHDLDFEANDYEKFFEVDFRVEDFSESINKALRSNRFLEDVRFPVPNVLIPKNLELFPDPEEGKDPVYRLNENGLLVFLRESQFRNPKCKVIVNAFFDADYYTIDNIRSFAYSKIFIRYLNSKISDVIDEGLQVSLQTSVHVNENSLKLSIGCFNDSLLKFLDLLEEKLDSIVPFEEEQQFLVNYNEYKSEVENEYKNEPGEIVSWYFLELIYKRGYDIRELMRVVENLNFEGFVNWTRKFYDKIFMEYLFIGNLTIEICEEASEKITNIFKKFGDFEPLNPENIRNHDIIAFPDGITNIFRVKIPSESHLTSSLLFIIQIPQDLSFVEEKIILITDILREHFYNKIRTEEQLGYSCSMSYTNTKGYFNVEFEIEGANHNPNYYSERIIRFLKEEISFIENLTELAFDKFKYAAIKLHGRSPLNIIEACNYYYNHIQRKGKLSNIDDNIIELIQILEKITKEDLLKFYQDVFLNEKRRRVLEIYAVSGEKWEEFLEVLKMREKKQGVKVFRTLEEFKEGKEILEDQFSVLNIVKKIRGLNGEEEEEADGEEREYEVGERVDRELEVDYEVLEGEELREL